MASQLQPGWAAPLLITCNHDERDSFVHEIKDWFQTTDCDDARYRLYGVFGFVIHKVRIDREFKGVCIYFVDICDAVHLKLCMADRCAF